MAEDVDVVVIGAGAIGVCSAYFLAKSGQDVVVIDRGEVCSGASYGNAGLLTPSHAIPLPAPGALTNGLKWLLDPTSPFYIKPRLSLDLLRWLWRFYRSSSRNHVERGMPALSELGRQSMELFETIIADESIDCHFRHEGWTQVFLTEQGLEEYLEEAETVKVVGIQSRVLDRAAVQAIEPTLSDKVIGGIHFTNDGHLEPGAFVAGLADRLRGMGVRIETNCEVRDLDFSDRDGCAVETSREKISARFVVLAGGAASPRFGKALGIRIPIEPAKGYAIIVNRPESGPNAALLLGESRIGATPMGRRLRFAGTLELAGNDMRISQRRVDAMMQAIPNYLPEVELSTPIEVWRGMRPCTPDGLPMIGRCPDHENVMVATGHGMLGVTQGPYTGKLVSELVCGASTSMNIDPFDPARFS